MKNSGKKELYKTPEEFLNYTENHPEYTEMFPSWKIVRDSMQGEDRIKSKREEYLPRPEGMTGEYAKSYDNYITRAHFPLICSYALAGALGIIINKVPEFNLPPELEYLKKNSTKNGRSLSALFLDTVIEVFQTGRSPLLVDIKKETNEFCFVPYQAENLINWKVNPFSENNDTSMIVVQEKLSISEDMFSHDTEEIQRALYLNGKGNCEIRVFGPDGEYPQFHKELSYMGKRITKVPLFVAGSINNSFRVQIPPLLSVANASIQIYRKEADLANSEFLSCNPTLILSGVSNDEDSLPNVVGSSVMIALPDPAARAYYTKTDTQALTHVREHIGDLYEEAIRHGIAILDVRKGVESAESLRIRQATQSASIYSIYLSAVNVILSGLRLMCEWAGIDPRGVTVDAPSQLTYGIPESNIIRETVNGFAVGVVPLQVIYKYLIGNGMLDQTVSFEDYVSTLKEEATMRKELFPLAPGSGGVNNNNGSDLTGGQGSSSNNGPI